MAAARSVARETFPLKLSPSLSVTSLSVQPHIKYEFHFIALCSFKDARSSDDGREIIIDRKQDCITIARTNKDEIAFRRKFDTCDEDDFPFHEGTMFIHWMRGEEPLDFDESFQTPDVPESDMGMAHLQLLRADSISIPEK